MWGKVVDELATPTRTAFDEEYYLHREAGCKALVPINNFYSSAGKKDGLSSVCIGCFKVMTYKRAIKMPDGTNISVEMALQVTYDINYGRCGIFGCDNKASDFDHKHIMFHRFTKDNSCPNIIRGSQNLGCIEDGRGPVCRSCNATLKKIDNRETITLSSSSATAQRIYGKRPVNLKIVLDVYANRREFKSSIPAEEMDRAELEYYEPYLLFKDNVYFKAEVKEWEAMYAPR